MLIKLKQRKIKNYQWNGIRSIAFYVIHCIKDIIIRLGEYHCIRHPARHLQCEKCHCLAEFVKEIDILDVENKAFYRCDHAV